MVSWPRRAYLNTACGTQVHLLTKTLILRSTILLSPRFIKMSVAETLRDVFNHIALPPKLPGKKDREPEKVERELITRLRYAVQTLCHVADDALKSVWESIIATLDTCSVVNQNGMVNKGALLDALGALQPGGAVIVNIGEQNAALLIRMPQ